MKPISGLLLMFALGLYSPGARVQAESHGFDVRDYQGRVVLLDFWGSWCPACRYSFLWMNTMKAKYEEQGLVVIAVNNDLDKQKGLAFLEENPADFQIIWDQDYVLARRFNVQAMPASFLLGPDGAILEQQVGFKTSELADYETRIQTALKLLESD